MDKNNRGTATYLVGIIIMFGIIIIFGNQVILPIFQKNKSNNVQISLSKPTLSINVEKTYIAKLSTSLGEITVELCSKCAPQNVNNFVYLSNKNYFQNTKVHRVVKDLLFQAGDRNTLSNDITSYGKGKTSYLIEDEVNWDYLSLSQEKRDFLTQNGYKSNTTVISKPLSKYAVAMANDGANTNSTQFFIITGDNSDSRLNDLNGVYTVIGEVKSGFDTLEKINSTSVVDSNNYLPSNDIVIQKIEITEI